MLSQPEQAASDILLISDNRALVDAVAANLAPLAFEVRMLDHKDATLAPLEPCVDPGCCKLVVLALSHSRQEQQALLAQVGLDAADGRIPLLVIAEQPFCADFAHNTLRLPLPLRANTLPPIVDYLLHMPLRKN